MGSLLLIFGVGRQWHLYKVSLHLFLFLSLLYIVLLYLQLNSSFVRKDRVGGRLFHF
jgi:hypothetical protein